MSWADLINTSKYLREQLQSFNEIPPNNLGDHDTTTRLFKARGWNMYGYSDPNLLAGLEKINETARKTINSITDSYSSLRGSVQRLFKEEMDQLESLFENVLQLGLNNLKEAHPEDSEISKEIEDLVDFGQKQREPLPIPKEVTKDDLSSMVDDIEKEEPAAKPYLEADVKNWIRMVNFYGEKIDANELEVKSLLDYQLSRYKKKMDRLFIEISAHNSTSDEPPPKALTSQVEEIDNDFTGIQEHYFDRLSEKEKRMITNCRIIISIMPYITKTSLFSQEKACEMVVEYKVTESNLLDIQATNYSVRVTHKFVTDCIADGNRRKAKKGRLNPEVVVTAYREYPPQPQTVDDRFEWKPFALNEEGQLVEGTLHSPALGNTRGLHHFWSKGPYSTSSLVTDETEAAALHTFLQSKESEGPFPLIIQLDHTWNSGEKIKQMGAALAQTELKKALVLNIPLVYSGDRGDRSQQYNLLGLSILGAHILDEIWKDLDSFSASPESNDGKVQDYIGTAKTNLTSLRADIRVAQEGIQNNQTQLQAQLKAALNQILISEGEANEKAYIHLKVLKAIVEGRLNVLERLEHLIMLGLMLECPIHVCDVNGLDRTGIGRAVLEGLSALKLNTKQLSDFVSSLPSKRGWINSIFEKAAADKTYLDTLPQNHEFNKEKEEPRTFEAALGQQIEALEDEAEKMFMRYVSIYYAAYTESLLKTKGVVDLYGTAVVGGKYGYMPKTWTPNYWVHERLFPCLDTPMGHVIKIVNKWKNAPTQAGLDIVHRDGLHREYKDTTLEPNLAISQELEGGQEHSSEEDVDTTLDPNLASSQELEGSQEHPIEEDVNTTLDPNLASSQELKDDQGHSIKADLNKSRNAPTPAGLGEYDITFDPNLENFQGLEYVHEPSIEDMIATPEYEKVIEGWNKTLQSHDKSDPGDQGVTSEPLELSDD